MLPIEKIARPRILTHARDVNYRKHEVTNSGQLSVAQYILYRISQRYGYDVKQVVCYSAKLTKPEQLKDSS